MSINRGMDKEDIYNWILLSHYKEWDNAIFSNMDEPRDCYIEWSKSDREGETSYAILYKWNLKRNDTDELILKTEILTDLENKLAKWEEWGKGWSGSLG